MAKKKRSTSLFAFGCGCGGSKSVSVSDSSDIKSSTAVTTPRRPKNLSSTDILTPTITSASTSSPWDDDEADKFDSSSSTPSFSGLLRQLNELEQTVMTWNIRKEEQEKEKEKKTKTETKKAVKGHKRSKSEGGMRVLEESVVVVKESEDPLGDFRRSMLQMIVEKEIVDKEDLSELLRQFLALNSPQHHHLILRAFAEIWEEIFMGYDQKSPEFLVHHACHRYPSPLPL
ncbi:hypothetical protein LUZ63_010255 [Rhynchospora breviuscula]|uniref:Transcription repressor n=1 Tax=Rhynchospora breviuscula TaxID=2022672 RepID=A0A9Q0CGJ9_9POAL|nr:hypothetical protein LUZ63_010255 [Rhynchospora breviuscula]